MNEERKIEIEEVEEASKPARARVDSPHSSSSSSGEAGPSVALAEDGGGADDDRRMVDAYKRKRDYLEGFLAQQTEEPVPAASAGELYEQVIDALKEIYDPEIPVNIYDLGLIYDVTVSDDGDAKVVMTLTTPHCPVAESMPGEVELRICAVPGIRAADVEIVWDPPWDPQKMSDEAKLELGML
jgi:FeS assembly SUF system protein